MSVARASFGGVKILHTSDWHLGRTFHGHPTHDALAAVLDRLPELVHEHGVEVVVVAGDVFDSSVPSAESIGLLERTLIALREAGAQLVVTSGNHDSPARLGFQAAWAELAGVHVRTDPDRLDEPVRVSDAHGEVAIYPVPYLEPALVRHRAGDAPMSTQAHALSWAMARIRASIAHDAAAAAASGAPAPRSVVVAHCFAAGVPAVAPTTDVERDITAGGIDLVPLEVFAGVDLVLLGHIHGRAELDPRIRYAGAPLHFSFSEAAKPRGAWLVELGAPAAELGGTHDLAHAAVDAAWLDLPVPRPLATLRGTIDDLLADPAHEALRDHWVKATLTDTVRPLDAMRRLQARFPHCALLEFAPEGRTERTAATYGERIAGATSDVELVGDFLEFVRGAGPTAQERDLLVDVLREVDGAGAR